MTKTKRVSTQYPDIFKILILNLETGKWVEPVRGKKFTARRYHVKANGSKTRVRKNFETLAEAKAFRSGATDEPEIKSVSAVTHLGGSSSDAMTFDQLVENWKTNWLPTVDLATQLRYRKYLKHFDYFSKMKVADIEPIHIDGWISFMKRPEYLESCHSTRCSYEHEFKVLRAILNYYSSRCNRSYRLPFLKDHRKMLKVKEVLVIKKDLTIEQFKSFVEELRKSCWGTKWESIFYLALMQYAIYGRIQEAAALHVEDFDLVNNRLEIKRKVQWLRVKGYKDRIVDGAKANGGKIFNPIPELAVQVLNEWKLRSGIRSGRMFSIDGELIKYRQIQHRYDLALKRASLPFSATHVLRHAALSEAYAAVSTSLRFKNLEARRASERRNGMRKREISKWLILSGRWMRV